jgi:ParB family chromosome partitioning protein
MSKSALGRGLGALLGGVPPAAKSAPVAATPSPLAPAGPPAEDGERVQRLALDRIQPSPLQPRKEFAPEALQELADSIRVQGIIQPLIVRPRGELFELIAGERRWRAAQLLGLKEIPVIVREADDASVLELALIENLQRENLNPLEEALGYSQLIEQFHLRQEDVAGKVGKSRAVVANSLRLLKLPTEVQNYLRDERVSVGHAKVILGLSTPAEQKLAAERIIKHNLNVRQAEELVAQLQKKQAGGSTTANAHALQNRDAHIVDLETRLRERLGTKVQLRYRQGKGSLEIRFFTDAELERLLQIVGVKMDD